MPGEGNEVGEESARPPLSGSAEAFLLERVAVLLAKVISLPYSMNLDYFDNK